MAGPLIICENLVKIFKLADLEVVALQGLDLTVQAGEMLGIVGASGSGKTTLLNVLGGLDRPSAGHVRVGELDLLKAPASDVDRYRRERVGFVWQQTTRNLIPYLTALENVGLPMLIGGREKAAWANELLAAVGLWDLRDRRPAQLSGGQQQRVAIALALANQPQVLLGDEPTGELDTQTASEIVQLLHQINERYGTTVLLVTHDTATAAAMNRVVTIRDGRTSIETVRRPADEAISPTSPNQPTTQFDQYVVVDAVGRLQLPEAVIEASGIGRRVTVEQTDQGVFLRPVAEAAAAESPPAPAETQPPEPTWQRRFSESEALIEVRDVWRTYGAGAQAVHALRGLTLSVPPGQLVVLRGRSGSGKTTLLNCIGGLDAPTRGEIRLAGQPIQALSEAQRLALRREQIGFVFQSSALLASYTAAENVELMLRLAGVPREQRPSRVAEALARVGLAKWAHHRPPEMSGGQQQRVAIARAIAAQPGLILADEPTGELDSATGRAILHLLRDVAAAQGSTILLATHDPAADEYADAVYLLQDGQAVQVQ
jgi:peptide/nickel transport system ATP-binding protein